MSLPFTRQFTQHALVVTHVLMEKKVSVITCLPPAVLTCLQPCYLVVVMCWSHPPNGP